MTLRQFSAEPATIPTAAAWRLADLGVFRGRQDLFARQSPQRLLKLREHALIESAVSSNRIEGVSVNQARVGTIVFGRSPLKDRGEEEVRGYRDALRLIHENAARLPVSRRTILELHRLCRGDIWDAGKYKERDIDIIETYADGRSRVRFRPVSTEKTPAAMAEMIDLYNRGLRERWTHPLILLAALNLDFLCVHPFRDGNGRVSRLLLLLTCYHQGYEVGRYIGLERIIEQNKERYYETLEQSSKGWHKGGHNPWPYIQYLLFVLAEGYGEFERRLGVIAGQRGEKTESVLTAIGGSGGSFRVADILVQCPGVGVDMVRHVLKQLKAKGQVECLGRGKAARWRLRTN